MHPKAEDLIGDIIVTCDIIGGHLNQFCMQNNFCIVLNSTIEFKNGKKFDSDKDGGNLVGAKILDYSHLKDSNSHFLSLRLLTGDSIELIFKENTRNGFFVY